MQRRLAEVRRAGQSTAVGQIVIIYPAQWPDEARAAYDAACASGNGRLQDDIVERQTGERPVYPVPGLPPIRGSLPPAVIAVRYVDPGPR